MSEQRKIMLSEWIEVNGIDAVHCSLCEGVNDLRVLVVQRESAVRIVYVCEGCLQAVGAALKEREEKR